MVRRNHTGCHANMYTKLLWLARKHDRIRTLVCCMCAWMVASHRSRSTEFTDVDEHIHGSSFPFFFNLSE